MQSQRRIVAWVGVPLWVTCVLLPAWGENVEILLDSADGSSAFVVKDSADTERMRVNSLGEMSLHSGTDRGIVITGSGSNIALGAQAKAEGGTDRIAIGRNVTNLMDNSVTIRGTLYLDGGTAVLYRTTFGAGGWTNLLNGYLREELDPVFSSSPAGNVTAGDIANWNAAFGWGNHGQAGYAAAAQLSAATTSLSAALATETAARIGADAALSNGIAAKLDSNTWARANSTTNFVARTGDAMTGALTINDGGGTLTIRNNGTDVQLGGEADASGEGVAVGVKAVGVQNGVAVGMYAQGGSAGAALGYGADGTGEGVAVGAKSQGLKYGVAVGMGARGMEMGVAVGHMAEGSGEGVAVGQAAWGTRGNIAIGAMAQAKGGAYSVALGYGVTNPVENSIRVRGDLYMDGGSTIYYNEKFGSPKWRVKAFTIDHPLDPDNKVLRHYCLEGPEVWNVYAGNARLVNGRAEVELPTYYSALNKMGSEIYSLTPIGEAVVWVESEVANNRFVIGGKPDVKVSWTIKVLRNDPACLEDLQRRPVEQWKRELVQGQAEAENAMVDADAASY